MDLESRRKAWNEQGFFTVKGLLDPAEAKALEAEVIDRIRALMEAGDVLFFHSYLLHMSTDNVADERRTAMVYHYGRAGTRPISEAAARGLAHVNRWAPVNRALTTA